MVSFFTGATGLEPAISGVTGQRDKPASLRPLKHGGYPSKHY